MAATLRSMHSSMAKVSAPAGCWLARPAQALKGGNAVRFSPASRRVSGFRCQVGDNNTPSPSVVREAVDKVTKKEITKEDILNHQETDQSEKQSVFGATPKSGSLYPRPELERRPETGSLYFSSIFAFDGAAPETINGRLAMLGFYWALFTERATGLTVMEQVSSPGASGLTFFIATVLLFAYASLIPIMNGESTDARSWGPFNAKAERWNGRLAMIGFAALIIDEMIRMSPVFPPS